MQSSVCHESWYQTMKPSARIPRHDQWERLAGLQQHTSSRLTVVLIFQNIYSGKLSPLTHRVCLITIHLDNTSATTYCVTVLTRISSPIFSYILEHCRTFGASD